MTVLIQKVAGRKWNEYREDNIEHIKKHRWAKFQCQCGGKYTHHHKLVHERSKKHKKYLKSIEQD